MRILELILRYLLFNSNKIVLKHNRMQTRTEAASTIPPFWRFLLKSLNLRGFLFVKNSSFDRCTAKVEGSHHHEEGHDIVLQYGLKHVKMHAQIVYRV